MSPARTAVLWDVLVADVGQVVGSIDVVPRPVGRYVIDWSKRCSLITSVVCLTLDVMGRSNGGN